MPQESSALERSRAPCRPPSSPIKTNSVNQPSAPNSFIHKGITTGANRSHHPRWGIITPEFIRSELIGQFPDLSAEPPQILDCLVSATENQLRHIHLRHSQIQFRRTKVTENLSGGWVIILDYEYITLKPYTENGPLPPETFQTTILQFPYSETECDVGTTILSRPSSSSPLVMPRLQPPDNSNVQPPRDQLVSDRCFTRYVIENDAMFSGIYPYDQGTDKVMAFELLSALQQDHFDDFSRMSDHSVVQAVRRACAWGAFAAYKDSSKLDYRFFSACVCVVRQNWVEGLPKPTCYPVYTVENSHDLSYVIFPCFRVLGTETGK